MIATAEGSSVPHFVIDQGDGTAGGGLRVALIGYGHAGAVFHGPLIAATAGLRLAAVVTADPGAPCPGRRGAP